MKFVIMNTGVIPGFGVKGPVLTPREYNVHQVLKWLASGIDVREVMEDGSYRKLKFSDKKLMDEACKDLEKQRNKRNKIEEEVKSTNKKLEVKPNKKQVQFIQVIEEQNKRNKKQEPKKHVEEVKDEVTEKKEPSFDVDELEPME